MDHQIVDKKGAKLVRVNDIALAALNHSLRVEGIDSSTRGGLLRLRLGKLARAVPVLIHCAHVDITHVLPELWR